MVVTLVQPLYDMEYSVVVHVECEEESEAAFHMLSTIIVANRMTFVLLLYVSICIPTINNIKLMIIVLLVCI